MFTILSMVFGGVFKLLPGLADSYFKAQQAAGVQGTKRTNAVTRALVHAAEIDVENRTVAAQERKDHPVLLWLYMLVLIGPILYYLMFWGDTIFGNQVWAINLYFFQVPLIDWTTYELTRAPDRLEEFGRDLILLFVGGSVAVNGVVKGVKEIGKTGLFKGK